VGAADIGFLMQQRFDFPAAAPPSNFYVIASSERSGSTYLCLKLWQTGLLGAPWEYLNYQTEMKAMAKRWQTNDVDAYMRHVVQCRTSANGVFAIKAHHHHFSYVLEHYPRLLDALPAPRFISIRRRDRLAQAISLARAMQTNAWSSFAQQENEPVYDAVLISRCLHKIDLQINGWAAWFASRAIEPLVVDYDELVARPDDIVDAVRRFVGIAESGDAEPGDAPALPIPMVERQADQTSDDWRSRYLVEALTA
jgi:LPS sulfotransferase NodH